MKKNKKLTWQQVWKLPLEFPFKESAYVYSKNGTTALTFNWHSVSIEDRHKIVDVINGKQVGKIENLTHKNANFFLNDALIFQVRGWGHLTGIGARNLPIDKAIQIQDEFINFIYKQLTKED